MITDTRDFRYPNKRNESATGRNIPISVLNGSTGVVGN